MSRGPFKSLATEVASEIKGMLRKADVPEQQLSKSSSKNDVLIAAHGITNELDVMSNAKLFLPVKELFSPLHGLHRPRHPANGPKDQVPASNRFAK